MNAPLKWGFLKCDIRKFTIDYTKCQAKERKKRQVYLVLELKNLENHLESIENSSINIKAISVRAMNG